MAKTIRIAGTVRESIVDGPGIRYVVFAQGCKHNCPGCHNPNTHAFDGGNLVEIDTIINEINGNPLLDGITLSGGEPFEQAEGLAELAQRVKQKGLHVITYTGYTYEEITEGFKLRPEWERLIANTDILVDGPFDIHKKSMTLKFRGSENQRIIDVASTKTHGKVILAQV